MKKRTPTLIVFALLVWPALSYATSCEARKSLPRIQKHCEELDRRVTLEGNPFVYTNPDAGCDLGLSLPGLPSFGGGRFGLDSCKILRSVTGDLVREINSGLQQAVDDSLGEIADDMNFDIDADRYIIDQLQN